MALICGAALSSCVSVQTYPEAWEAPSAAGPDACPDLNGTYADTGQSANGARGASLAGWILQPRPRSFVRFDRVDLALSGDELVIHASGADASETRTLSRHQGDFQCSDGVLKFTFSESCCMDMVSEHTAGVIRLSRTPGYVVLNASDVGAGIIIFVPFVFVQHAYVRFERIDKRPLSDDAEAKRRP